MTDERRLALLTRFAMVGDLNDRHMKAVPDGEYLLRSDVLAALPQPATEPETTAKSPRAALAGSDHD